MSSKAQPSPEELTRRDIAIWNDGEVDRIEDVYDADCVYHDPFGEEYDRDSYRGYVEMIHTAFPDFFVHEEETLSERDSVMMRYTFGGTMEGEYRGFEPTGKSFELHGLISYRIEDGRIVEAWNAVNSMAMAQQLGLLG
jgi:steroid delta-isomerase-like uncharacterized protein